MAYTALMQKILVTERNLKETKMLKDDVTTVNPQWREEIGECVNNQEPDWCGALVRLVGDVASIAVHGVDATATPEQ